MKELNNLPVHVAIIMDGNGRWARQRRLLRTQGHLEGVKRVEEVIKAAADKGVAIRIGINSGSLPKAVLKKFSKPTARVLFANVAVVSPRNGVPHLMFRLANQRGNQIVEARLQVALARWERTLEGETMRRFYDLELVRQQNIIFALTWTAMHAIDERSPLFGATAQSLMDEGAEFAVSFVGLDETMSQTVHARWSYRPEEILWNHRYTDIISILPGGKRRIDYRLFHDTHAVVQG